MPQKQVQKNGCCAMKEVALMKYCNTLIAVKNMEQSLQFYKDLFNQDVTLDLGWCKTLTCGLTLQEHFDKLVGLYPDTMHYRSNTMELYFETEDFEAFLTLLNQHPDVERLHEPQTFPWLQRGIRIFDPDGHLIEVSENMYSVACKQFAKGHDTAETARLIQHPLEMVEEWFQCYRRSNISLCGSDCSACDCYKTMCNGCNLCEGKVFHSLEGCAIYNCAVHEKSLKDCGSCKELPCTIWKATRDPRYSDEKFEHNVAERVQTLMQLTKL